MICSDAFCFLEKKYDFACKLSSGKKKSIFKVNSGLYLILNKPIKNSNYAFFSMQIFSIQIREIIKYYINFTKIQKTQALKTPETTFKCLNFERLILQIIYYIHIM